MNQSLTLDVSPRASGAGRPVCAAAIRPSSGEHAGVRGGGAPGGRVDVEQHVLAGGHQCLLSGAAQLVEEVKSLPVVPEQPGSDRQPVAGMSLAEVAQV